MVRFLLLSVFSSLLLVSCINPNKGVEATDEPVFQTLFSPQKEDGSCYRIPAMITAANGDLIVVADERLGSCADLRTHWDINIVMRRSTDNGITWSEKEVIVDYPFGESASDPSLILDEETGVVFLFFNYMNLETEKEVYYFKYIKSADHGKSWSDPVDITSEISKPGWKKDFKFITSGRGMQTRDGRLIHTLVSLQQGLHLFGSDDHGESWYLIDTPIKPADESKVIELDDGRWMINSRVSHLGHRYVHLSSDKGASWTSFPDTSLWDPACNASLIRYAAMGEGDRNNVLLFANAFDHKERVNLTLHVSYDEGATWPSAKTVYPGGSAYVSMTLLQNGKLGILFEKDDYKEINFVLLDLTPIINESE
ncbi:MAG: sialidase [Bacteroidetes bacterium]|nr:MAG: sialidase [Bacteroidota bacterium]